MGRDWVGLSDRCACAALHGLGHPQHVVATGGQINVDRVGFAGGAAGNNNGNGPGKGSGAAGYAVGAGHGGIGTSASGIYGQAYDSESQPVELGSGGGGSGTGPSYGGNGGGAVYVIASGNVTVNGTITADGGDSQSYPSGGGSGGSIYINCSTFAGTNGWVKAEGRGGMWAHTHAPGGGGGRVAIVVNSGAQAGMPQPSVELSARHYPNGGADGIGAGTVYVSDGRILPLFMSRGGRIKGISSWSPASLSISNAFVSLERDGFTLNVGQNLLITRGSMGGQYGNVYGAAYFYYGNLVIGMLSNMNANAATVGTDMVLTNGGALTAYGAWTDNPTNFYSTVTVTGAVKAFENSWVLPYSHPTNGGSVKFTVASLALLPTTPTNCGFNADARGFWGGDYPGHVDGWGPGRGQGNSGGQYAAAGSHGGRGASASPYVSGPVYGSSNAPVQPGSGGGGDANANCRGGSGGGAIVIECSGAALVNGLLTANGGNRVNGSYGTGHGAGGSVYLRCATFAGTNGMIRADGAGIREGGQQGDHGAGGRVAVVITDPTTQAALPRPSVQLSALHGFTGGSYQLLPEDGTAYLSHSLLLPSLITETTPLFGPMSGTISLLTVSNGYLALKGPGVSLTVLTNVTVMPGTWTGRLDVGYLGNGGNPALSVGGSVLLTAPANRAWLYLYGGSTDQNDTNAWGALLNVTGDVRVPTNTAIYPYSHPTNGGSPHIWCKNLIIDAGGAVNASYAGFQSGTAYSTNGFGPGGGRSKGDSYGGGGAYGGAGQTIVYAGGTVYGSSNMPHQAGSGGGAGVNSSQIAGNGGGLIRVEATRTITVNGSMAANGGKGTDYSGAAGSGGGIWLKCRTLNGSGTISANADFVNAPTERQAAGGGGRIALWTVWNDFAGTPTVNPSSVYAGTGTVVYVQMRISAGSVFFLR